jgi:hypothetical protein
LALKFLLHLVGDLHQPLHVGDDHDQGGNQTLVSTGTRAPEKLHLYWDFDTVAAGRPEAIARRLSAQISAAQAARWSKGSVDDWAKDSYDIARRFAYGALPARDRSGVHRLDEPYQVASARLAELQLSKAGVRLAVLLNRALAD